MSYQCGLGADSDHACNHACSPVNGYRGTYMCELCYLVHRTGLKYTELGNSELLSGARLMEILGNGIPLVYESHSISVHTCHAAGQAARTN